jgi:cytochrome o ubiquinol oxidase operon protein cyoD
MSERDLTGGHGDNHADSAPGDDADHQDPIAGIRGYLVGLVLAALLTGASFVVAGGSFVWGPGIPVALVALAIGQMGVHLVFFLHITTGPDNTNNTLALLFGVLIVGLVLVGTLWIMANLQHNMVTMDAVMRMQR